MDPDLAPALASLAADLVAQLAGRGLRLAVAESCTGGAAMAALSSVPGASQVLWGGAVVYTEDAKVRLAGIPAAALTTAGPVSEETTRALALAMRERSGADLGAAVTGWAGPDHGAEPAGTVYLAVADTSGCRVQRALYDGTRNAVREQAVMALLELVLNALRHQAGTGRGENSS